MKIARRSVFVGASAVVGVFALDACGAPAAPNAGPTAGGSSAVPLKPSKPVTLNLLDVAGHLHLPQGCHHASKAQTPDHHNSWRYTGRRKVEPSADQIRIRSLGIHFRPVWRMMGKNGQIDLDAMDGREVFSEVRGGRTDAMVVD